MSYENFSRYQCVCYYKYQSSTSSLKKGYSCRCFDNNIKCDIGYFEHYSRK